MNHITRWLEGLQIKGIMVEIGSERGEGSTAQLAVHAHNNGLEFYSIDIEKGAHQAASNIQGCTALWGDGTAILDRQDDWPIGFAYLDNFDWIYPHLPAEVIDKQIATYERLGYEMNNLNSWLAHLQQAQQVDRLAVPGAYILFDDTWEREDGCYDGKGGAAVPWLLTMHWRILKASNKGVLLTNA